VRTVLALAAAEDWELENMDVDTAFLNSPVDEDIYIKQPEGFEQFGPNGEELVCKLKKSLYGLKQAPRNWNVVIDSWLREYGFVPNAADACVYVMRVNEGGRELVLIVLLWVDDLIIAGNSKELITVFKRDIGGRFKMKDLGALKWILGFEVRRNRLEQTIEVLQTAYIDQMLGRFGMSDCKPVATPMEGELEKINDPESKPEREYMSIVGSLLYAAIVTRPDIAYAVQTLGRHMQASGPQHYVAAKRVLRYLKGTRELGIVYRGVSGSIENTVLVGFCDADWAGDRTTRRSTTAYVFVLCGGAISWASKLQGAVALSSTEAEYYALGAGGQEAVYLRRLLDGLGYKQEGPTVVKEDNQGCIALSTNPVHHKRTKHIDIKHHYVRELIANGEMALEYVATERQLADLLTKPLQRKRIVVLREAVMGHGKMG
jgi:hypothetical protein